MSFQCTRCGAHAYGSNIRQARVQLRRGDECHCDPPIVVRHNPAGAHQLTLEDD